MEDKLVKLSIRATTRDFKFKVEEIELKKTTDKSFIGYGERISKSKLNVISEGMTFNNHKWISFHCYCYIEAIEYNKKLMLKKIANEIKKYEDELFKVKDSFVQFSIKP